MAAATRPDILLIVLDTLRADRLSCYGHPTETSPHLDAYAARSTRFERAISPAQWTIPSHASLFTGEYPSTHQTTQIYDRLPLSFKTLAQHLQEAGYTTVGFCNNPLLGVVENELDRGFNAFYNYGGLIPERPRFLQRRPRPFERLWDEFLRLLNSLNGPIQELFTRNELLLGIAMHPWLVPLWERNINFKGNTALSLRDMERYLRNYRHREQRKPLFVYLNLMEPHLPYRPPRHFVRQHVPYYDEEAEARDFMESYNYRTYEWITPIVKPFTELQHRVLNDMYNAEVAYQDYLLGSLLKYLDTPEVRDNTLVLITSDHGEGLDHHDYVGHSLVTYEDLIRVPLMVRYPALFPEGHLVSTPVSTRRIFHTLLDAAQAPVAREDVVQLSLVHSLNGHRATGNGNGNGHDPEGGRVFAESYPPYTMLKIMESRNPAAIETFRCRTVRRAFYDSQNKLITHDEEIAELYDVRADPLELDNRLSTSPDLTAHLYAGMRAALEQAQARRPEAASRDAQVNPASNRRVADRLRKLGYLE